MPNHTGNLVDGIAVFSAILDKTNFFKTMVPRITKVFKRIHSFIEHIICDRYYFRYLENNGECPQKDMVTHED